MVTMWLLCGYYVVTMWLICGYYVVTRWLLCSYYVVTCSVKVTEIPHSQVPIKQEESS